MQMKETDWETLLRVWMHDPVDKALDIRGHEARAKRYVDAALHGGAGGSVSGNWDERTADQLASMFERLPMPTAGRDGIRAVGPEDGRLHVIHPLSGVSADIECPALDETAVIQIIRDIVDGLDESPKTRFLELWRLLPDRVGFPLNALPADTRIPDHSLVHHADITAGIWASMEGDIGNRAFLSFALGPVQPFIAASRSLRDLWTGSVILSYIAFAAMRPILDNLGPTAFVYPALRENPLMDIWLRKQISNTRVPEPDNRARVCPSLPHRFLALVPWGDEGRAAGELAEQCRRAASETWLELSDGVRKALAQQTGAEFPEWERDWEAQVREMFSFHVTVVPERDLGDGVMADLLGGESFADIWPDAARVRALSDAIPGSARPRYDQKSAGRWPAQLDLSARIMAAERMISHIPVTPLPEDLEQVPRKCSLLGSFEQMGPAGFSEAKHFWESASENWRIKGVRLRKHERFSAIALTKRFAMPAYLERELGLEQIRFPDTATVAAAEWLRCRDINWREEREWNGRWLHENNATLTSDGEDPAPDELLERLKTVRGKHEKPPTYYAILMMDGDDLGAWLRGEHMPKVRDVVHPKLCDWYDSLDDGRVKTAFDTPRPVGPALHAAISGVLGRFATRIAPKIIEEHTGTVIYSGGDDLLALLPVRQAVACAHSLREAYRQGDGVGLTGMGEKATLSAGLAFVHYKEDLRLALAAAREAEVHAKGAGEDAMVLRFMRRSGEHSEALLDWDGSEWFTDLISGFGADDSNSSGAVMENRKHDSNRWAYRLRAELPVLTATGMPAELITAEIRRLGNRVDDPRRLVGSHETFGARLADLWTAYRDARQDRSDRSGRESDTGAWLHDFTALCQGAAFIARGRDD
ncbi:MAG: type III-B CRISPR-associated protein Cas10/Cmr2 [Hyphomonadaceae bacterium]|nr:type III-B CRISPR-associated protein Cas10/Cmr2 [Hyphomonadaceae bacterium]